MRPLGIQLPLHIFFFKFLSCFARIDGIIYSPGCFGLRTGFVYGIADVVPMLGDIPRALPFLKLELLFRTGMVGFAADEEGILL